MAAQRLRVIEFKDDRGRTPSDDLTNLLDHDEQVMPLATFILRIKAKPMLVGQCINRRTVHGIDIQFWRFGRGHYFLVYCFVKAFNEICFLEVYKGVARPKETDGVERASLLYRL